MIEWFGDNMDKDSLVQELKDTVGIARDSGLTRDVDTRRLLQFIEGFRTAKVKGALEDATRLKEDTPRGTVLAILGRGHEPVVRLCEQLREHCEAFMQAVEAELAGEIHKIGTDPVGEAIGALNAELDEAGRLLRGLTQ